MEKTKNPLHEVIHYIVIILIASVISIAIIGTIALSAIIPLCKLATETETDEINRDLSVVQLSELKGRITEISYLRNNADEYVLLYELADMISCVDDFKDPENPLNKYLGDFTLTVPDDTSDIGELCEILIKQIDDQISDIRFGKADA